MSIYFIFVAACYFCLCIGKAVSQSDEVSGLLPTVALAPLKTSTIGPINNYNNKAPPETFMTTPEIIRYHGYTVEEHKVTTANGYILTLFRIPDGKVNKKSNNKTVLLQHGMPVSSDDWLLINPESILPYLLAEAGYDVWLGNARGNTYSNQHTTLSQSSLNYWNFSFHEMGVYDINAVIEYIINITGVEQISYIGHSMGATTFFIAMIRHPELQSKVDRMIALAPFAYIKHTKNPIYRSLAIAPSRVVRTLFDRVSGGRFLPAAVNKWLNRYSGQICAHELPSVLCTHFIFLISGFDPEQLTIDTTSKIYGHLPSPTSIRTIDHVLQILRTDKFQEYGGADRPLYNLTLNRVPTLVMYGDNDRVIMPKDALRTVKELGNVVEVVRVNHTKFGHLDFTYAKDVKELVYDHCLRFLA